MLSWACSFPGTSPPRLAPWLTRNSSPGLGRSDLSATGAAVSPEQHPSKPTDAGTAQPLSRPDAPLGFPPCHATQQFENNPGPSSWVRFRSRATLPRSVEPSLGRCAEPAEAGTAGC